MSEQIPGQVYSKFTHWTRDGDHAVLYYAPALWGEGVAAEAQTDPTAIPFELRNLEELEIEIRMGSKDQVVRSAYKGLRRALQTDTPAPEIN